MKTITIDGTEYNLVPVEKKEEPEWKILEFRKISGGVEISATLRSNGLYLNNPDPNRRGEYTLEKILSTLTKWNIYSVEYKGNIFTVGDEIMFNGLIPSPTKIEGFLFGIDDKLNAKYFNGSVKLEKVTKVKKKKPVFTTEDGIEMFAGNYYWCVYRDTWQAEKMEVFINAVYNTSTPRFYSREKAFEYIEDNKPKYSLQDIKDVLGKKDFIGSNFLIREIKNLKK